jgi:hypothetical protein
MTNISRAAKKLLAVLFPPTIEYSREKDRSVYERFAIPFAFKPRLSVLEATVAAAAALLRIFLGCILFAVWGTYTLQIWFHVPNLLLRLAILIPLLFLFLISLALMMVVIAFLARAILPAKTFQM